MTSSKYCRRQPSTGTCSHGLFAALLLAGSLLTTPASAEVGKEEITSGAKGTVGLALLGAEAVIAVEAAIGLDKWWMYAIGGGAGAVAGGVGGYFIDKSGNAPVSMGLLVGGIVFAVPTTIALLSATAYKPPKNPEIDDGSSTGSNDAAHYARTTSQPTFIPSLVDMKGTGSIQLKVPALAVVPVYSQELREMYSLPSAASIRVPVLQLAF